MEQFARFELLIGNKINEIQTKTVLVIGMGGVGSYAVEALTRSGIGHLILVDYDTVDITNLNRQLMALHSNIGKLKVAVWKERILDINPLCQVELIQKKITLENIDMLFQSPIDYIIDACDDIKVKKQLIRECLKRNIRFISSMGTGNKFDPTKLDILDIRKTSYDPIAKQIRNMVKSERIKEKIMVVCSNETPHKNISNQIGSTSYVPSVAGLLCASFVINDCVKRDE